MSLSQNRIKFNIVKNYGMKVLMSECTRSKSNLNISSLCKIQNFLLNQLYIKEVDVQITETQHKTISLLNNILLHNNVALRI